MSALFVLSVTLLGFFIGLFYGSVSVPHGRGLAELVPLLGYGALVAFIGFILALRINRRLSSAIRKRITVAFLLFCLILVGWFIYRLNMGRSKALESPVQSTTATLLMSTMGGSTTPFNFVTY